MKPCGNPTYYKNIRRKLIQCLIIKLSLLVHSSIVVYFFITRVKKENLIAT